MEKEIYEFRVLCLDNDKRYRIIVAATPDTTRRALIVQAKKDIGTFNFIEEGFRKIEPSEYLTYFLELSQHPMVIEMKES